MSVFFLPKFRFLLPTFRATRRADSAGKLTLACALAVSTLVPAHAAWSQPAPVAPAAPAAAGSGSAETGSAGAGAAGADGAGTGTGASAATATASTEVVEKKEEASASSKFPISGDVRFDTMFSAGTFAPGESRRSGFDTILGYRFAFALPAGFTLAASQLITKTIVTNADSGAVRPDDTTFGDLFLSASWAPRITKADGTKAPYLLPGGVRIGLGLTFAVPNSRLSRFQGKYGALTPAISLSRPKLFDGRLSLSYSFAVVKNFNKYTNAVVSADEFPTLARPSGPELAGSDILTSAANTSFSLRNMVAASVEITKSLEFSLTYLLFNGYRYYSAPDDQYTSVYAKSGRGRADSQWGIVALTYSFDKAWSLAAQAYTVSPPFSADNKTFRFPFYDFRSTADNYSSVGLELQRNF